MLTTGAGPTKTLCIGGEMPHAREYHGQPVFVRRLDDLIVFHKLEPEQVRQIADLMLNNLSKRLKESNFNLKVTNRVRDELAKEGFSEMYGARPLRRLIEDKIENAISLRIINGELKYGDTIEVDYKNDEYIFKAK